MPLTPKKTLKPIKCGPIDVKNKIDASKREYPIPFNDNENLVEHVIYKPYREVAMQVADITAICINTFTPESAAVPHAKQYVLEEVIKILQSRV